MNVIPLQVFVSLVLVAGAILLLVYSVRHADHEHADRLSLLPIEEDETSHPDGQALAEDAAKPAEKA